MARTRKPLKQRWREFRKPIACNCGCGKRWSRHDTLQAKAHFLRHYGGYWAGQKARSMGRKIGKDADRLRRMGRAGREAAGLTDRRGNRTAKARSRPDERPVRRIRDLRHRDRHGRDSTRADTLATRHETRATRSDARAERATAAAARLKQTPLSRVAPRVHARAATHRTRAEGSRQRAIDTRMAHHQRWPERTRT